MAVIVEHLPERSWHCLTCEEPWPCAPARERLAFDHRHDQMALAILLRGYFEAYALEAGEGPLDDAYERFIGWSRRAPERERRTQGDASP